jgi:hypothetical protein
MNANEISSKADNFRMNQIKKVSPFLRTFFLISAIIFGVIGVLGFLIAATNKYSVLSFSLNFSSVVHAVECWFAYKLFSCYVTGDLFTVASIQWMRWIGIMSLLMGGWDICHLLYLHTYDGYWRHVYYAPWIQGMIVVLQFIFFQLVYNLAFGVVIIFIAWIMDEGRKIREEQELTV